MILIAGPCVIDEKTLEIAQELSKIFGRYADNFECYFKSSYDKANRTCGTSYRGPGLADGLKILRRVKKSTGMRLTTDVHAVDQVEAVAKVVDMVQVPAFLCRQTDLLYKVGACGREVNIKKGQFMAPWDMIHAVEKVKEAGCKERITVTERGASFGYSRLVVDMCSIPMMRSMGIKVILDCTHSLQLPGAGVGCSASQPREFAKTLAYAATAVGVDGLFFEVYQNPNEAKCDGPNSIALNDLEPILERVLRLKQA